MLNQTSRSFDQSNPRFSSRDAPILSLKNLSRINLLILDMQHRINGSGVNLGDRFMSINARYETLNLKFDMNFFQVHYVCLNST